MIDEVPMLMQKLIRSIERELRCALEEITDDQLGSMIRDPSSFTAKHIRATKQLEATEAVIAAFHNLRHEFAVPRLG